MSVPGPHQIPLDLGGPERPSLAMFLPGGNAEALAAVERAARGRDAGPLYLWGPEGSGKSHLLLAACRLAGEQGRRTAYLPLGRHAEWQPALLEGLEGLDLVAVDEVGAVAGESAWEQALFHLFNRLRDGGRSLLLAGAAPPAALPLRLEDLKTRLGWGLVLQLRVLDDDAKRAALMLRAHCRGFDLPGEVAAYLLQRCPRDLHSLFGLLDRLDRASLAAQRRITVPFVRALLDAPPG